MASPRIRFWFHWTVATTAGMVLARLAHLVITLPLARWLSQNPVQTQGQFEIVVQLQTALRWSDAVMAAMLVALVQVLVLRRVLRAAPAWIAGAALGALVFVLAAPLLTGPFRAPVTLQIPSQSTVVALGSVLVVTSALIPAGLQWLMVLHGRDRLGLYIVASVVAALVVIPFSLAFPFGPADPLGYEAHWLLGGVLAGVVTGALTGLALVSTMGSAKPRKAPPRGAPGPRVAVSRTRGRRPARAHR